MSRAPYPPRSLTVALLLFAVSTVVAHGQPDPGDTGSAGGDAASPPAAAGPSPILDAPALDHGPRLPLLLLDDAVAQPMDAGLVRSPGPAEASPPRYALPAGLSPAAVGLPPVPSSPGQEVIVWRLDDGMPALHGDFPSGPEQGYANRFDPIDFYDTDGRPPSAVTIHRIHFYVRESGGTPEPTGPMEWHIWEDNGGHKADTSKDVVAPLTVEGGPGENIIDLDALGVTAVIDPPRLFHVGVANKESEAVTPDIELDDGLPYVGDSGDFHASLSYNDDFCGRQWGVLATEVEGKMRSPVYLIWLEVSLAPPPGPALFEALDAEGFTANNRNAWGDYDGDGREDLLARGGVLYRNNGDGTFTDVTAEAGITDTGAGALWADYDNDGDLDFFQYTNRCVPCQNPQEDNYDDLWRNNGDGTFTNVRDEVYGGDPAAPVPRDPLPTEAAAWGDFNGDGYLDLYTANHVDWGAGTCYPDYLWLNSGPPDYSFRDVSEAAGIRAAVLCGRGVNPSDFDADGDLDIFVSNYRLNRDLLWINTGTDDQGVPQFVNEAGIRGVQGTTRFGRFGGSYGHTIGSAWGDLDGDGDMDLVASRLAHSAWLCFSDPTMLYESEGRSGGFTFKDRRAESGVEYTETHSEASLADIDNDGFLDLHITQVYDGWRTSTYRNLGERPFRFENITASSGIWPRTGWGAAWSDFDSDGDLDLAGRGLWRNGATDQLENRWLQVKVTGCGASNRDAIGATVAVMAGRHGAVQRREVAGGRGTGTQDSPIQHFGLGAADTADQVVVGFPSGQGQTFREVAANQRITVTEVGAYIVPSSWAPAVGDEVALRADTCGQAGSVSWDLDDDGAFDDAEGSAVTTTFRSPGQHQVGVRVTRDGLSGVQHAALDVARRALYLPRAYRQ